MKNTRAHDTDGKGAIVAASYRIRQFTSHDLSCAAVADLALSKSILRPDSLRPRDQISCVEPLTASTAGAHEQTWRLWLWLSHTLGLLTTLTV
ncbi:hypothetical protein CANARDRAFT_114557 [[Candida] arabinofermentans NRRL YB-2248]|uniref:Uncharacterized protein n=1 Tax=[Candida] arabinofermentans NRRL YB-2248 TaxID=983967 RepID=A0A1E4T4T1_9ASCO|nr:hypothetical protein CANARDRAFT_114557 [[Candida] arabinofermentans NRRL YB-2248]